MPEFDATVPNAARIYDCLLGGKNNYAADRRVAAQVLAQAPHAEQACSENRAFLGRVVRCLIRDHGIRQFLDLGSGMPARDNENLHEIAQSADPRAAVVYVDYDHTVATYVRSIAPVESTRVAVVEGDIREPAKIMDEAGGVIDFGEPVAVLMLAVLHFLRDDDDPHGIVHRLAGPLVPGSAVAVSHLTGDGLDPAKRRALEDAFHGASAPLVLRPKHDVARYLDGFDLLGPGVTDVSLWPERQRAQAGIPVTFYGGAGVKPHAPPRG